MKNSILALFFGMILTTQTNVFSQTSTEQPTAIEQVQPGTIQPPAQILPETPAPAKVGFFENIWNKAKDSTLWVIVIPFICGILSKNGITKIVKAIAGKTTIVTKELSDVSLAVSNFSALVDKSIKEDGSVDQNSLKQAIDAGKTVMVETKEAWVSIKPKTATVVPAA